MAGTLAEQRIVLLRAVGQWCLTRGVRPGAAIYTPLARAYCSAGNPESALAVVNMLGAGGMIPSIGIFLTIAHAFSELKVSNTFA
jgi:pentatricopeptide repeat protein